MKRNDEERVRFEAVGIHDMVVEFARTINRVVERGSLTEIGRREMLGNLDHIRDRVERLPYVPKVQP